MSKKQVKRTISKQDINLEKEYASIVGKKKEIIKVEKKEDIKQKEEKVDYEKIFEQENEIKDNDIKEEEKEDDDSEKEDDDSEKEDSDKDSDSDSDKDSDSDNNSDEIDNMLFLKKYLDNDYLKLFKDADDKIDKGRLFGGEKSLADLFVSCGDIKNNLKIDKLGNGYYYNINNIWEEIESSFILNLISEKLRSIIKFEFNRYLKKRKTKAKKKIITHFKKLLEKVETAKFLENIYKLAKSELLGKDFNKNLDNCKHIISFKNGIYDIKTKTFRKRVKEDYITCCLDYDYVKDYSNRAREDILKIFSNISNDDKELTEFNLDWLGYCLTGETAEQKFLMIIGDKASNGKSTMMKIFKSVFPIYYYKAKSNLFELTNNKRHKTLAKMKESPVRLLCIEELSKKKQDIDTIKEIVDGEDIENEILFATMQQLPINYKIIIISNKDSVFDPDNGIIRRGLKEEVVNRFISKEEYDKIKNKKGIYIKDKYLLTKFKEDNNYRIALCHILIERASKYYEKGLYIPDKIADNFKELAEENDNMLAFLNKYFIISEDDDKRIYKKDFLDLWNREHNTKTSWITLLSDVKRHVKYRKDLAILGNNAINKNKQGVLLGLELKPEEPMFPDEPKK